MRQTGVIQGYVCDELGRPVAEAAALISKGVGSHPDIAALTGDDGCFSFDDLVPGEYDIFINTADMGSTTVRFTVVAGSTTRKTIRL